MLSPTPHHAVWALVRRGTACRAPASPIVDAVTIQVQCTGVCSGVVRLGQQGVERDGAAAERNRQTLAAEISAKCAETNDQTKETRGS
jgi:hypothetical protein